MQLPSLAHPAQPDSIGDGARGQIYLYPHPLTLARDHAEAEWVTLADSAAYSSRRLAAASALLYVGPPRGSHDLLQIRPVLVRAPSPEKVGADLTS